MKFEEALGWAVLGVLAVGVLSSIANNPRVSPNIRFIARTAQGDIVQDMETGLYHLLV